MTSVNATRPSRTRRRSAAIAVLLVVALCAACGSRLSDQQLTSGEHRTVIHVAGSGTTTAPAATQAPTTVTTTQPGRHRTGTQPGSGQATTSGGTGISGTGPVTGSTNAPTTSTTSTNHGGTTAAACTQSLPPINIGTIGEYSGIFGPIFSPMAQMVQAWAASVNASGGIDCHPVKYYVEDDGGDPSVDQSEAQTLVEQDHVIALVQESAPLAGAASVKYLTDHRIPTIGSEGGSDWFNTSPMFFPQFSSGLSVFKAFVAADAVYGLPLHKTKFATLSCIEAELCSKLYSLAPELAKSVGLKLVYRGQASLTSPDFTSNCQAAKKAGAQIFFIGLDTNSIERVMTNCASVGYHPTFSTGGSLATPALLKFPLAEGSVFTSGTLPFVDTSNAQVRAMDQVLKQFAPGVTPSAASMAGWISAQLFTIAAQHLSQTPTSADILNGLWKIHNNDVGGTTYPLTFRRNKVVQPRTCFWVVAAHNGTYVNVGDGKLHCVS